MAFESTQISARSWLIESTDENCTVKIDKTEIELIFITEIRDLEHMLGEKKNHPITVSTTVLPVEEDTVDEKKEQILSMFPDGTELSEYTVEMARDYGFTIPINPEKQSVQSEKTQSKINNMNVVGTEVCFKEWEEAEDYVTNYLPERCEIISSHIESYLDSPINKMGTTGWDVLRELCVNSEYNSLKM